MIYIYTLYLHIYLCILELTLFIYTLFKGSGGVVATFKSHMQKVGGSNPTQTTYPKRNVLRILLGLCNLFWLTEPNDQETVIEG